MMKLYTTALFFLTSVFFLPLAAQQRAELPARAYELYPTLRDMHGFAVGEYQQSWLIFGGLIRSDVPQLYPEDWPNTDLILIDLLHDRAAAFTSGNFQGMLGEQLSAAGLAFYQEGDRLFLAGGYGYSETHEQFLTFPYLTIVDLPATIASLENGGEVVASCYQICDENLAVFDAVLDANGETFFLVGGKYAYELRPFEEKPQYHEESRREEVRTFKLDAKDGWQLTGFQTWYDLPAMRDYFGPLLPPRVARELERLLTPIN